MNEVDDYSKVMLKYLLYNIYIYIHKYE